MRLAIAGKGGAGKSMVAGTLARLLARRGHAVLALDSDPLPGLAISLGLGPVAETALGDEAERGEDGRWRLRKGVGPARAVRRHALEAPDGVRLLHFGKADSRGLAGQLPSVQAFAAVVRRLRRSPSFADWTLVGDLPAGTRQMAFGWAPYADTVVIVVEPTWQSALTARRIARIAGSRPGVSVVFVANKVAGRADEDAIAARVGERPLASVAGDAAVLEADRAGRAVLDHAPGSAAVAAVARLADALERRAGR